MVLVIICLPWSVCPSEYHAITFAQKHLGSTANMIVRIIGKVLVNEAYIANARPDTEKLPGRHWLCFVVEPGYKVPRNCRAILRVA